MGKEEKVRHVLENGFVKLTTLITAVLFCAGVFVRGHTYLTDDALWKQAVSMRVDQVIETAARKDSKIAVLESKVKQLEQGLVNVTIKSEDRWSRKSMREWIRESLSANPDWKPYPVDKVN